jgi:AcrR family transcriptional regulator
VSRVTTERPAADPGGAHWQERVVDRSLRSARGRSLDRGTRFVRAAAKVLERNGGASLTVQEVADEAGQSLRTLYQYFAGKDELLLAVHEEAVRTLARLIRAAIAPFEDPHERLAGALLASVRILALHDKAGIDRGLSHVRRRLGEADPALVARSQEPVTSLLTELVDRALEAEPPHPDRAMLRPAYFVVALRSSLALSITFGDEFGMELPGAVDLSVFCFNGLGLIRERTWHDEVDARLELSGPDGRSILRRLARGLP